ncbi:hypothetical protein HX096_12645 [Empedobacter falsenii]|uniref:hypothetical protein n=1 Tax=Empedobacter falsenii TaxID=343874 RepID=UPI00257920E6|nr:hypothetical protein [Empedobacter falsenii]MDM1548702.1 hypothetical protein [Empedobacter falsenii]
MPLNKTNLKNNIIAIMQDMMKREETSIDEFAERLATAIDEYVKDAEIVYTAGLTSATGGVVTGTFEGNLK